MSGIPTLNPLSPEAVSIFHLFIGILLVMLAIFLLVAALMTVAIIRYRDREGAADARQEFGNPRLEIIWTVIPALLLIVIFGFTVRTIHASDPPIAGHAPDLRVIGHQWWWEADYLGSGVVTANEIHIPTGRPILIDVESADVIHDFWVPELGRKIDAIPGHPNHIWISADKPGEYLGTCAEFCGNQHAWMRIVVIAQTPEEFAAWQRGQLVVPAVPTAGVAAQGAQIFRDQTCINCHTVAGTLGNQRIGPDLTHLGDRSTIAAGAAANTPANLLKWLEDPSSIKPETHMPNFQLSATQAHALVAYMETLKLSGLAIRTRAGEPSEAAARRGLLAWVASVDHKQIGIMYLLSSLLFFGIGGIEALLIRIQLAVPNNHFLGPDAFNQIFTMHGTTMIFLVVMPTLAGMSIYAIPLMIGARDVAFPRLNAMSFWLQLFGGILLYFSFFGGGAPNAGWFSYTPLSEPAFSITNGLTYWVLALTCLGISSIAGAINMIVTIVNLRVQGQTIRRLPLFVWMTLVNSFLILMALPVLNAALVMLLIDRLLNAHVFAPAFGGSALLWQHYFWGFGHPEVYIMVLPAFGMISEIIPVFSGKPIYGYGFVAASTVAIAFLSFTVWAHHMFAVGMGHVYDLFFVFTSMSIAVPTGVKIFNWTVTLYHGRIRFTTSMMFALGFLVMFTIGGLTGVSFAVIPIDWQLTDTYYLVAHFHYVLFGGTAFAILAGLYYWFPKMSGKMLDERLGKWHFWLTLIGFNLTFFLMHPLGMMGMPRRVYTYPDLPGWAALNMLSTIGAFILLASVLVFLWNIYLSLTSGKDAGDNPWDAWTLEWATSSPPPPENFTLVPPVHGRRPLWDLKHPDRADELVRAAIAAAKG